MHKSIELPILYFGTPVVLISTTNDDGSTNIAPSSSIWWLAQSCMVGLDGSSKTTENLKKRKECVLNLASAENVSQVDGIANTTGMKSVPLHKRRLGYRYLKDKAGEVQFNLQESEAVKANRIKECKVQLEATVEKIHRFSEQSILPVYAFELNVVRTHVCESLLMGENHQYVDPDKWHPLIMNFRKFYTTNDYIHPSKLSEASAEKYHVRNMTGLKAKTMKLLFGVIYRNHRRLDN
ncbi:MAG: flavin reductase family protein [Pseudomonadota bacterium]|nr:flavin reductase family protein [Pseudomonadota bacterium]